MAVSGEWMRRNMAVNPMYQPWTVVDPRHTQDPESVDERRRENIIAATPYQPVGTMNVQDELEPAGDASRPIDNTPVIHGGTPMHAGMTPAESWAVHAQDLGAADAQTTTFPRVLLDGDAYHVELQPDMDAPPAARGAGDRPDLVRGLNAFSQNNPGKAMYDSQGWRRAARWQKVWTDHDLALPQRFHRFRVLTHTVAITDVNTPPPGDTVYAAAWPSLARVIRNNFAKPRMRRMPGPIDETVISDGTDELAGASVGEWV